MRTERSRQAIQGAKTRLFVNDGARLRHIGVETVDGGGESFFDDATFELHREGEGAVVEGKVIGKKGKALDGLVLREVSGEPLNLSLDEAAYFNVSRHLRIGRKDDSFLGNLGGNGRVIGNDQGDNELAAIPDDHGIQNVRAGLERIFDGLRRDKFSGGGFEQVLFAIGDEEVVVLVEIADVAGVEPTVFGQDFARGVGALVVTLHHQGTTNENLAVFGDADFAFGDGLAGTANAVPGIVAGDNGRGFRQSIALIDGNADGPKEFGERL